MEVVAGRDAIETMRLRSEQELLPQQERGGEDHNLTIISLRLEAHSPLVGKALMDVDFRSHYHCMVVGVENAEGHLDTIQARRQFVENDIVWFVGEEADLSMLSMAI